MGVKLHEVFHEGAHYSWCWWCPGCEAIHQCDTRWTFNGSQESPTFRNSVLVHEDKRIGRPRCHSFVTDGRVAYLDDCTHALKGTTVEIPDWPADAFQRDR